MELLVDQIQMQVELDQTILSKVVKYLTQQLMQLHLLLHQDSESGTKLLATASAGTLVFTFLMVLRGSAVYAFSDGTELG
jgi:hypothetical protein